MYREIADSVTKGLADIINDRRGQLELPEHYIVACIPGIDWPGGQHATEGTEKI